MKMSRNDYTKPSRSTFHHNCSNAAANFLCVAGPGVALGNVSHGQSRNGAEKVRDKLPKSEKTHVYPRKSKNNGAVLL